MKAIVTYEMVLVTENGSVVHDTMKEILPADTPIENIYKRKTKIHGTSQWLVNGIKIDFANE